MDVRADEAPLEAEVSRYIGEMPFVWIDIGDKPSSESLRGVVERNSIGLLSNHARPPLDAPSGSWLGFASGREPVRSSGLWNCNHTRDRHSSDFTAWLHAYARAR